MQFQPLRKGKAIALALAAAFPSLAQAQGYTLLIFESPAQIALRDNVGEAGQTYWEGYAAIGREMATAGILKGGASLDPVAAGSVPPGAARDGKAILGGYFIIDVPSRADALAWAARVPAARTGRVDVRTHAPAKTGM